MGENKMWFRITLEIHTTDVRNARDMHAPYVCTYTYYIHAPVIMRYRKIDSPTSLFDFPLLRNEREVISVEGGFSPLF